ncbi:SRPBCC family protein [Confluentibacter flavum]|uniref:Transcription activator effector-binding protein n=1 Tax=Confluentibacter flavum TaxID=1909700 RepID=A0A2N3HMS8_9FLAO|nr:GyrI-like domain-containing protein [Confluentibacter flavum]PKQ46232.1 transcription activator effector-binding protein [Confluentibacter flavum]
MKTFKYIAFLLLVAIIGTAIYIAVQPNEFSFNRSRVIQAPVPVLFNKVNDFKNWPEFSPWLEQEPDAELTYGEKTVGVGAYYSWNGAVLGEGSMETRAVEDNKSISQHISFIKPFESESNINWDFEPIDEGTKVTWSMEGKQDFMTKMYTVFSGSIEKNTAPDFERGLFKLDSTVTADMKKYSITVSGITNHSGGYYLYSTTSSKIDEVASAISDMLPKITKYAQENNIAMAGAPFVSYIKWDEQNNAAIFSVCVPTTDRVITTDSDVLTGELPTFRALKTTLKGNYTNLKEAWDVARDYIPKNGLEFPDDGPMLEVYITDQTQYPNPADWVTDIYIAVK